MGKGTDYEVLHLNNAVRAIAEWVSKDPNNSIEILKTKPCLIQLMKLRQRSVQERSNLFGGSLVIW